MTVGNTALQLTQNCPNHPEIRITGVRITEGPLYIAMKNDNYY